MFVYDIKVDVKFSKGTKGKQKVGRREKRVVGGNVKRNVLFPRVSNVSLISLFQLANGEPKLCKDICFS